MEGNINFFVSEIPIYFSQYSIFSNKHPRRLLTFETVR